MKKLIIVALMAMGIFGINQVYAQKVIKDANGKVYISSEDLTSGVSSTTTLNLITLQAWDAAKVYKKFQIAKDDLPTKITWAIACGINTSYGNTNANGQRQGTVNTGCAAYSEDGVTGWRVPTYRELMLMCVMERALVQAGVSSFKSTTPQDCYFSSTEFNNVSAFQVGFNTSSLMVIPMNKGNNRNVRCVREVN